MQCPYHGWEYNKAGECTKMPSTAFCKGVRVHALPCSEKDGEPGLTAGRWGILLRCTASCAAGSVPSGVVPLVADLCLCFGVAAGLVWVWPGSGDPPQVPDFSAPPSGYTVHSEIEASC